MYRLVLLLLVAAGAAAQAPPAFDRGVVIPRVACAANPEQTYALYLPSYYTPERSWPVLFAFDPAARGRMPVDLAREAAEKYGYIVAGSNNSENGPWQPQWDAARAPALDALRKAVRKGLRSCHPLRAGATGCPNTCIFLRQTSRRTLPTRIIATLSPAHSPATPKPAWNAR